MVQSELVMLFLYKGGGGAPPGGRGVVCMFRPQIVMSGE